METTTYYNEYFNRLINGEILEDLEQCPIDSGLYLLFSKFVIGNGFKWLKIGMTVDKKGLQNRLKTHFKSKLKKVVKTGNTIEYIDTETLSFEERNELKLKEVKSRFSSILGKHLWFDKDFCVQFNLDLTKRIDREEFIRNNCYFKILPLPQFNWKTKEEKSVKRKELKKYEDWIELHYGHQIRYIGSVKLRKDHKSE